MSSLPPARIEAFQLWAWEVKLNCGSQSSPPVFDTVGSLSPPRWSKSFTWTLGGVSNEAQCMTKCFIVRETSLGHG